MFIAPLQDEVSGLSLGGKLKKRQPSLASCAWSVKSWSEPRSYLSDI